jgi:hypothetical protein
MNPNSNVTPIESKQAQVAARFTITATLDGFPFTVEAEGKAEDLRALVSRLKAIGAQPPSVSQPEPTKQSGVPTCPIHNAPMKSSRKPGKFYCAKKAGDGEYCRETA